jgi:hypothetical protein
MTVYLATKTLAAIDEAIKSDQGAAYRGWLGKVIGHMDDAYRTDEFPFRTHLGASGVGDECARKIWYGFRWATLQKHGGRLLRLFNRGHLEEARFIAMLLTIGAEVYQQDENGKQYRISDAGGHFGGSGDGIVVNIPDLDPGVPALCEFKTSAEKPFLKVQKEGVRAAKFEHYVQMQIYMRKMGLAVALYMVVNKNNDELYGEIVPFNATIADEFIARGVNLVWKDDQPQRISESPGWFACKWCDHRPVCHLKQEPHRNCRTCVHSKPLEDGNWYCMNTTDQPELRSKEQQFEGCPNYQRMF